MYILNGDIKIKSYPESSLGDDSNMDTHFGNILFDKKSLNIKLIDLMLKKNILSEKEIKEKFEEGWNFERTRNMKRFGYLKETEIEIDIRETYSDDGSSSFSNWK